MIDRSSNYAALNIPEHREWEYAESIEDLEDVLDTIGDGVAALDFETTSLYPEAGEVRLVQLCNDDVWIVVDFWHIGVPFKEVAHWFEEAAWVVFYAGFEQKWFEDAGAVVTCWDVAFLRRAMEGGGHFRLAQLLEWDYGIVLPKEEQKSNWGAKTLTNDQLVYAADDALYTFYAWKERRARAEPGHLAAFDMFNDMVMPVMEMEETGLILDVDKHRELVAKWGKLRDERMEKLRELITEDEVPNLNSGAQLSDFFASLIDDDGVLDLWPRTQKTGLLSTANRDLRKMAGVFADTAFQDALLLLSEYKTLVKYLSSFGESLINTALRDPERRVHARYNIGAAITGRFSSSGPNLQQIPRDRDFFGEYLSVRQSFISSPECQLVSLDYSGIELRVLALLSGDEQLLEDMVEGDVHLEMGSYMAGRRLDKSVKEDKAIRQSAKPVSFGIVYGITELGLSASMRSSISRAEELIQYWASRYPKAFALRVEAQKQGQANGFYLPVVDGGTIFMGKKAGLTKYANYPVQRAALSIMAKAIARHHESLLDWRDLTNGHAYMASTIHDALIDEVEAPHAYDVLKMMKRDMVAGYLDIFPGAPTDRLVEGGFGPNWGDLEEDDSI